MANNAEHRNPKLLDTLIKKYNVDVMTVTPSLMKINYDNREANSALANVKNMVFGGEPLPEKFVQDLRALANDITIYNIYGPSEITVLSNVQNLNDENEITVGKPIINTQIHILDKNMNPVPIGVIGEIYISGIQVGLGYLGRKDLTDAKFLKNPFGDGKIYESGDIGRWTFDGKVQCLGRIDNQVKLRGLRIELGEIENIVLNISGVSSAVVNKVSIDEKESLCAYYVSDKQVTDTVVREALTKKLPPYMVPTYIMKLEKMPYTINRKIDRKSLPLPQVYKTFPVEKININELDSNDEKLLQIWRNILKVQDININDNFFEIGGDSISAINMQIEALKYGLKFEYADIFNYPTIKQLSSTLPNYSRDSLNNFDYSRINKILALNNIENISSIKKFNVNNVLLIGATGYLGSHILNSFIKNNSGTVYCLLRQKDGEDLSFKLRSSLDFYFGNGYFSKNSNRIKIIKGDIISKNLGISEIDYSTIVDNVSTIINSAALVKHFGLKEQFYDINVLGTENIVDFCKLNKKRLLHISTISVSGYGEKDCTSNNEKEEGLMHFSEQSLYVGQNLTGIYSITKYKAEIIVLQAISDGLDAQIFRIGNITNRFSDGLFQRNINDNAFVRRIKSFIEIGAFPESILSHSVELTPVDLCADSIVSILNVNSSCNVFHIYNPNLLSIKVLYDYLHSNGYSFVPINDDLMSTVVTGILQDDTKKDYVSGIIQDLSKDKKFNYISKVDLNSDFTCKYLEAINFNWPIYDTNYIEKCFNYFDKINFINKE